MNVRDERIGGRTESAAADCLASAIQAARVVMVLRTDAIGDNVIGMGILEGLRAGMRKNGRLVYACQDRVAGLIDGCPLVDEVMAFSRGRAAEDEGYRGEVVEKLRHAGAEVVVNPMFTREGLADALVQGTGARMRVGFACGLTGLLDEAYTDLIAAERGEGDEAGEWRWEGERVKEFLRGMGLEMRGGGFQLRAEEEKFAERLLARDGLAGKQMVVLFAGAGTGYRVNRHMGTALAEVFNDGETAVVSVGSAQEFGLHQELMAGFSGKHINMCGRTSVRKMAAIIQRARMGVGAETGAAHLACAVGTPHVVVMGGGHFGRFLPWADREAALTTIVCLPLECFRCDWNCRHSRAHCVADVEAGTIAAGIRAALAGGMERARIVTQQWGMVDGPPIVDVGKFLKPGEMEIISASSTRTNSLHVPRLSRIEAHVCNDGQNGRSEGILRLSGDNAEGWNREIEGTRAAFIVLGEIARRGDEKWMKVFDERPDCELLIGDRRLKEGEIREMDIVELFERDWTGSCAMWRRGLHEQVGYFDAGAKVAGDYEFWLRAATKENVLRVGCAKMARKVLDRGQLAYETMAARERYWKAEWGIGPRERMVEQAFARLGERVRRELPQGARVGIFGAGQHTRKNWERLTRAMKGHAGIAVVLDDRAADGREIEGVAVAQAERWREFGLQGIVVSSDTYEQAMIERTLCLVNGTLPVLAIYRQ